MRFLGFALCLCLSVSQFCAGQERGPARSEREARERALVERAVNDRNAFERLTSERARVSIIESKPERWEWVREESRKRTYDLLKAESKRRVSEWIAEREMTRWLEREKFNSLVSVRAAADRPQGFDAVYERQGYVVVCEAKGTSRRLDVDKLLGTGYGERQGTTAWAVGAAEAILNSKTSNWRERRAAERVLEAEEKGKLLVLVFVTTHNRGSLSRDSNARYWNPLETNNHSGRRGGGTN